MRDTIDRLVRSRAAQDGDKPMVIDPDVPDQLPRTRHHHKGVGGELRRGRRRQGHPGRADHAQRRPLGAGGHRADPHRRRAGSAEHPAAARRTGRAAAGRVGAIPGERRGVPRPPLPRRRSGRAAHRTACTAPDLDGRPARRGRRRRRGAPGRRRDDRHGHPGRSAGHHVHLRQQRGAQGGRALARQRVGRGAVRPCGAVHHGRHPAVSADAVLLGGRLRQRHPVGAGRPAPPWSPRRYRGPTRRCDCWKASGSRCFAAGPTRPRRWRGTPRRSAPTSRRCGRAACKRCCRPSSVPRPARGPSCSA